MAPMINVVNLAKTFQVAKKREGTRNSWIDLFTRTYQDVHAVDGVSFTVEPGEIVVVDRDGMRSLRTHCSGRRHHCIFEYIYFARADSIIDGVSVYEARLSAGRLLAKQ